MLGGMSIEPLHDVSTSPRSALGPFRRGDYDALPAEARCELISGWIVMSPSPIVAHQVLVSLLWRLFDDYAAAVGGFAGLAPLDCVLSDHTVVQPDVLYVAPERLAIVGDRRVEGAPDLVVEVLSPATMRRDRQDKLRRYAEAGVQELWLADPAGTQVEFLVNRNGVFSVRLPLDGAYVSEVFPGLRLDLDALWAGVARRLGASGSSAPAQ